MPAKRDKYKVRKIAQEYVRNGFNLNEVVGKHYNCSTSGSRAVMTHKLKYSPEFIEEAKKAIAQFDKSLVSPEYVICKLYELIEDNSIKASDKVNALSLCSKILQMTADNQNTNNIILSGLGDRLKTLKSVKSIPDIEQKPAIDIANNDTTSNTSST